MRVGLRSGGGCTGSIGGCVVSILGILDGGGSVVLLSSLGETTTDRLTCLGGLG